MAGSLTVLIFSDCVITSGHVSMLTKIDIRVPVALHACRTLRADDKLKDIRPTHSYHVLLGAS